MKFLREREVDDKVIEGAGQYQCSTCAETIGAPKLARPAKIHDDLDFNDVVGADGVYWTSREGKTYHFMHFIDEGTLYHLGIPCGRSVEDQIRAFESCWLLWAGPCSTLYLDPAGEYANDRWAEYLQHESIKVQMTAARSHWQNGRCERHGRIIKDMLTRMDSEEAITSETFPRCLREAFAAKNSLSRVKGFTPEQCLLGKARRLPASLTADDSIASHEMALSDGPEGIKFRQSLLKREQARRAFIAADNDNSFRRALLRRTRPARLDFQAKDWVLYWCQSRGNNRSVRGRWHGPAQVITVEPGKVAWLSHCGQLIRASPEHLRPASLREFAGLPRDSRGSVQDERLATSGTARRVIILDALPDEPLAELPARPLEEREPASENHSRMEEPEHEESPPSSAGDGLDASERQVEQVSSETVDASSIPIPAESPLSEDEALFGDDVDLQSESPAGYELAFRGGPSSDMSEIAETHVATSDRKQLSEIQWDSLSPSDQALFRKAKDKEIQAWLDHSTVKRVSQGTWEASQIMGCRWILVWKPPEQKGGERRAKARLVIQGFTDPGLSYVPNDAPTLTKDARMMLLQMVSSQGWTLINFDVSTAFLKGENDGRMLGIRAPPELQSALKMQPSDQCQLTGGAYGRIDAPYLWHKTFRGFLESVGFIVSPFDGCLFSLVTLGKDGSPRLHGVLGLHVDDGIGGGDAVFQRKIAEVRNRYSFGAYNEKDFVFCGVKYHQWPDGTIELDQIDYVNKIDPVSIHRERRQNPEAPLTLEETRLLRQACGSVQYAAVNTRPDLAAKVGELQSAVGRGTVGDLLTVNRVIYEAKSHPVCLSILPIPVSEVTFCAFTDASFATNRSSASRQGTLIFATNGEMVQNKVSIVCPMAWSSRKIPRVVRSTLSAETVALRWNP